MSAAAALAPVIIRPWPRRLDEREAATYLGISASKFRAGWDNAQPRYPQPMRDGRRVLWDIKALDSFVDGQGAIASPSPAAGGEGFEPWGGLR